MIINKKRFRQALAFCLLLFFPFNNALSGKIMFHALNPYIFLTIGIILLIPDMRKKATKKIAFVFLCEMTIALLAFLGLKAPDELGYMFIQLAYLFTIPILLNVDIDKKAAIIAITVFAIEHIFGTLFPIILPDIYEKSFLPFVCKTGASYCPARIAFETGMSAGITNQTTTNGCYMAIFTLFYMCRFLNEPCKKNSILAIITFMCLLMIGKRAHLLFTVISLFIVYITRNNNFSLVNFIRNNLKIIIIGVVSLVGVIAVSNIVPQIGVTIDRIVASKDSDDVTSGRGPLYELAIEQWEKSLMLGNGWGSYVLASHEEFGASAYGSDYIHAHNDYLELLCDIGLLGAAVYIVFIAWLVKGTYRIRNNGYFQKFSFAYIIFFVLYGLTGTPLFIISNFVFLLVIILIKEKGIK